MSKIKVSLMAVALFAGIGVAFANTNATRFSTEFYTNPDGSRINIVYLSGGNGPCTNGSDKCHAPYNFNSTTQQWELAGSYSLGTLPF